jgi:hypothetical protein
MLKTFGHISVISKKVVFLGFESRLFYFYILFKT